MALRSAVRADWICEYARPPTMIRAIALTGDDRRRVPGAVAARWQFT
jgi:hypothetical protein